MTAETPRPIKKDTWYKASLPISALGVELQLHVPHDVFSTVRVDEGTLLLLENLPPCEPRSVLDMGCGYGALGLPIARRFPGARVEMVDRDLLAVAWSAKNAEHNGLANAAVHGSLGFRDVDPQARFDWVLCNVPARIGRPFIEHFLERGRGLLAPGGELRVVVIRDLAPVVEAIRVDRGWPVVESARGPRHVILSLPAGEPVSPPPEPDALYLRDEVEVAGLSLQRPFDLGGDDPRRIGSGLPVLLDVLPRMAPKRVFAFRCGYGVLPLVARARWPEARVVAVDRDLLGTTFTRRNAERCGLAGEKLQVREAAHFPDVVGPDERFDLAIGEISPSAGARVAQVELEALAGMLERGGQALLLALTKLEKEWIGPISGRRKLSIQRVISRDGYSVLRLAPR